MEVRITGLRELNAAFKRVGGKEYGKALQQGMKGIAERIAGAIRSKVPGAAGSAVRARGSQRGAAIAFPAGEGRERFDYYPWLDFGGSTGRGHRIGSAWSGSVKRDNPPGGRYVYPTIAEHSQEIADEAGDVLLGLARKIGFETHG